MSAPMSEIEHQAAERSRRPTMPSLAKIADTWASLSVAELEATFPETRALTIGWGEPFCFRCGWLAPIKDMGGYPKSWKPERKFDAAWSGAGGWLEKAHLRDHQFGGSNEPLGIVPLCPLCHEEQGPCESREQGIAFVNSKHKNAKLQWIAQLLTDEWYRDKANPGRNALRALLRAYAEAGRIYADALGETA